MAANSIARLAVQIVTDTSGMQQGFQNATTQTRQFATGVQLSSSKLSELAKQGITATGALGRIAPLAGNLGAVAGPAGLAATTITALAVGLARAADASEDFRIEKLREFGKISPDVKTFADHMAELREQFSIFAEGTGFSLKPVVQNLRDLARETNVLFYGAEKVQQLEAANKYARELAGKMAEQKKAEEQAARAAKEAADEAQRQHDEIIRRGESIAKSLRTPSEIFDDTLKELRELASAGAITGDVLQRGIGKAADEFRNTAAAARDLKREATFAPALEVGTQGFRSAVLNFQKSARGGDSALAKASLEVEKRIAAATESLAKRYPITFKTASL